MKIHFSGGSAARWLCASALTLAVSFAVETRFWQQSGQADFSGRGPTPFDGLSKPDVLVTQFG